MRAAEKVGAQSTKACSDGLLKPNRTKAASRTITSGFHESAKEAMHQRAKADPTWMQRRRQLAEHPFGTMKWSMGRSRFLVRGLHKARSELALTVLGFNMKRRQILGVPAVPQALA